MHLKISSELQILIINIRLWNTTLCYVCEMWFFYTLHWQLNLQLAIAYVVITRSSAIYPYTNIQLDCCCCAGVLLFKQFFFNMFIAYIWICTCMHRLSTMCYIIFAKTLNEYSMRWLVNWIVTGITLSGAVISKRIISPISESYYSLYIWVAHLEHTYRFNNVRYTNCRWFD